jgi:serine/threonine protein kinase
LSEPRVVPIHSFGEIDGRLFVDMRLIEGRDLAAVLSAGGPLSADRAVAVAEQVGAALSAAHRVGVVGMAKLLRSGMGPRLSWGVRRVPRWRLAIGR